VRASAIDPRSVDRSRPDGAKTEPRASVDRIVASAGAVAACLLGVVLLVLAVSVVGLAMPSVARFGVGFVTGSTWDPIHEEYGALPFLFGTAVTSLVALAIAAPVGLGVAMFVTDLGPAWARRPVSALVGMLSAIPSVVYGLWGAAVVAPILRTTIEPWLEDRLGAIPLFRGPTLGVGLLCASLILAMMALPTIAAVSREVLRAVPADLREGGLALGATRWEVVKRIVLPHAKRGILAAIVLGFARATGETMAVAAVVGSQAEIATSLFAPGYTMSSVIANQFATASTSLHVAALAEVGVLLLVVTVAFNVAGRLLVGSPGASWATRDGRKEAG
jgi:phosphate transport system permease protein